MTFGILVRGATAAVLAMLPISAAWAQTPAEFYKGRNVDIQIGYSVGGGYDVYARLIARYLGKYIPGNPTVIPRNMEGAASLRLANYIYNAAPEDGTALGIPNRGAPFEPLLGETALARYDATKYSWVGSSGDDVSTCVVWNRTGITNFEQLIAKPFTVGGTGAGADTNQFPKVLNGVFGAKMKVVSGYPGGNDIDFAMERGEVDGRCGWSYSSLVTSRKAWLDDGSIKIVVQLGFRKHKALQNVPIIMDFAKTEEQRQILRLIFARNVLGYPFIGPPGIPAERAAILRKAFEDTMKDPAFLADAKRGNLEIAPVSGAELQQLVAEIYRTPAAIVAKTRAIVK